MQLSKLFSLTTALFASAALASPGCRCGIKAIFEVGSRHGCNTPSCACPNFDAWWPEVDQLLREWGCPEDSNCACAAHPSSSNATFS